jgi:cytosine/adenosine deaminase-related metal-dependent hydrolase
MSQNWNFKKLILEEIRKKGGWVNAHVHADRAFTVNPDKLDIYKNHDLVAKWDIVDEVKNASADDYYKRFAQAFELMIEQGVSAIGTFVDVDPVAEDRALLGALKAKFFYKDQLEVKLINQTLKGVINKDARKWFDIAAEKVDIIGGLPRRDELDHGKGLEAFDILMETAKKYGKLLHVHVDQFNVTSDTETEILADKTIEHGMEGKVVAIHSISIAAHNKEYRHKVYKKMQQAKLMVIACPFAWIDGNRNETMQPFHNSLTPVDELYQFGIPIAIGTDNIADYMLPFNDGDMWPELRLLAQGNRFLEIDELVKIATDNGRKALGLEPFKAEKVQPRVEIKVKEAFGN